MTKKLLLACGLYLASNIAAEVEISGVFVADEVKTESGQTLLLNGAGLREKFWVDVYVGSLYLPERSSDVAQILSRPGPLRIQMDFIYKEVSGEKLVDTWREGFENNQSEESLKALQQRIERFYSLFADGVVKGDLYRFDYRPDSGMHVSKNDAQLGVIPGEDFRNALVEIWLGNKPGDKGLKKELLGL